VSTDGGRRVARVAQVVSDLSGERLRGARVLDLGAADGWFSIELAKRGAGQVVAIEGREENLAKAVTARDALGLDQVELIHGDARELSPEAHGQFDVVLCLGLLYHLDVPAVFELAGRVASVCRGYALIETQVALSARERIEFEGRAYRGAWYPEDVAQPGASLDNPRSFWLTRPSLLNLLADVGFTSVSEVLTPVIPALGEFRDHVLLVAVKGTPVADTAERWPERPPRLAHPTQGFRHRVRERLARRRGGGLPAVLRG
jgi:SAM-dependent methyltransferase